MPKIDNGAELVRQLAKTGTGEGKLAVARKLLADTYQTDRRVATSGEVITALEAAGAGEVTLDKARQLRDTGEYVGPVEAAAVPFEEQLLSGAVKPAGPEKPPDAPTPTPADATSGVMKTVGPEKVPTPPRR